MKTKSKILAFCLLGISVLLLGIGVTLMIFPFSSTLWLTKEELGSYLVQVVKRHYHEDTIYVQKEDEQREIEVTLDALEDVFKEDISLWSKHQCDLKTTYVMIYATYQGNTYLVHLNCQKMKEEE